MGVPICDLPAVVEWMLKVQTSSPRGSRVNHAIRENLMSYFHPARLLENSKHHLWPLLALLLLALLVSSAFGQDAPGDNSTAAAAPQNEADSAGEGTAKEDTAKEDPDAMPPRFAQWLDEVELLISGRERGLFKTLREDYQREAFIQEFWKVRDPFPRTPRNELKERWPYRVAEAKNRFDGLEDHRSRIYMVHGRPANSFEVRCTKKFAAAEVWIYRGTEMADITILVVFYRPSMRGKMQLWDPAQGRYALETVLSRAGGCINGQQLVQVAGLISSNADNYNTSLRRLLQKPRPRSEEWVHTFVAHSTDVPRDADVLDAHLEFAFPGRNQHRTVVQGFLTVPIEQIAVGEFASYRSHDLLLTGEVLAEDILFENFRYKFGFEEMAAPGTIPLSFQRFLAPGQLTPWYSSWKTSIRIESTVKNAPWKCPWWKVSSKCPPFKIPAPRCSSPRPPPPSKLAKPASAWCRRGESCTPDPCASTPWRLAASTRCVSTSTNGSCSPKTAPPYNVELDLGSYPDLHTVRVEALDDAGLEVASDEVLINGGGYRFSINLVEPYKGKRYANSLRARAEVEVPADRTVERVEFYLNEILVATLYQEPYVHPIVLPPGEPVAYVRAVAYLPDGNSTEDLVFINAPDYLEEVRDSVRRALHHGTRWAGASGGGSERR